jgi:hypothetical protein
VSIYELAILGDASDSDRAVLIETINKMVDDFGVQVRTHDASTVGDRNIRSAFAAVYFGGPSCADFDIASSLTALSLPINRDSIYPAD